MHKLDYDALKTFFAAAPGAIQGHLNVAEIKRIALTTVMTSGAAAIVPALLASVTTIVAPQDAALAAAVVTIGREVYRRLGHGTTLPAHSL
jgi:hypothetical protein